MNSVEEKQLKEAYSEYIKDTGIGQFTYLGFADWFVDEYPDLVVSLLAEQLRQLDSKLMADAREKEKVLYAVRVTKHDDHENYTWFRLFRGAELYVNIRVPDEIADDFDAVMNKQYREEMNEKATA